MIIRDDCSGCGEPFRLSLGSMRVAMDVEANGKRGSLHVAAHTVTGPAFTDADTGLVMWDCPRCGYAESQEVDR